MGISTVATYHKNFEQLINEADKAMYIAKNNNRNRIEVLNNDRRH